MMHGSKLCLRYRLQHQIIFTCYSCGSSQNLGSQLFLSNIEATTEAVDGDIEQVTENLAEFIPCHSTYFREDIRTLNEIMENTKI